MKISEPVMTVLSSMSFAGNVAFLPKGQLDRKLYLDVNKVLAALGGKWHRGKSGHVFEGRLSCEELVDTALMTGEVVDLAKKFEQFFTPGPVAESVIAEARIERGMRVLEPSAGVGALALRARAAGGIVTCVEIDPNCRKRLVDQDLWVDPTPDFLDFATKNRNAPGFDRIVMNPPFSNGAEVRHILAALDLLAPGGRLVAIASAGVQFRQSNLYVLFRQALDCNRGIVVSLAPGSFADSGTNVNTVRISMVRR